jgi:pimeloyl-ACP methyl ester carboxylesterase
MYISRFLKTKALLPFIALCVFHSLGPADAADVAQGGKAASGFAEVNGTRLFYEAAGKGPAVVLIHGGLVDSRLWDDQFREFSKRYRVVRYDLRGFGRSASPAAGQRFSHLEDLRALLGFLKVERATLVGLSLGGIVAADFALEYPQTVERLVLVGAGLRGAQIQPDERLIAIYRSSQQDGPEKYADKQLGTPFFAAATPSNARVRARLREMLVHNHKALATLADGVVQYPARPTVERLADIKVPTLVVVGSIDHPNLLAVADILPAKIPGARKVTMPGASHHPPVEQPKEFNRILSDFLRKR